MKKGGIRRTQNELKKKIPVYSSSNMILNNEKLHRDLIKRLNELKKPQAYLTTRLGIARSTFWRISKNKEITLNTYFKLVEWLDEDLNTYVIKTKTN